MVNDTPSFTENPGRFGLGRFGQIFGWVVWALVGGSLRS